VVILHALSDGAAGAAARECGVEVAWDAHLNQVLAHMLRAEYVIETDDEEADAA